MPDIEPLDLTAEPAVMLKLQGSSDPDSLDYGGLLNLLPIGRGRQCNLHPVRMIGEHGCPRCWEIRDHQVAKGT